MVLTFYFANNQNSRMLGDYCTKGETDSGRNGLGLNQYWDFYASLRTQGSTLKLCAPVNVF